jgi:hypothetical protein
MINTSVDQTTIHWSEAKEEENGLVKRYCTFTAKNTSGLDETYKVTLKYNRKNLGNEDKKKIDETIEKVIAASIDQFPGLVGTTVTFKPDADDSQTIINRHTNKDYEGKSLKEIKDKDVDLYNRLNWILLEFNDRFKKKKVETVELDVESKPVQHETIPAPKVVDKKPNNNNNNNNVE